MAMDRDGPAPDGHADDALRSEVDRISGDILDGTLPSADAPSAPGSPLPSGGTASRADAIDRAMFVARTLDDIAAPLPSQAGPPPPGPSEADVLDAWFAGVNAAYDPETAQKPAHGASPGMKRNYGRAVAGVLLVGLAVFLGAFLALQGDDQPDAGTAAVQVRATATPTSAPSAPASSGPSDGPMATASLEADAPSSMPATASASPGTIATTAPGTTPRPQSLTLRGPIDTSAMTSAGLQIGQHEIELVVFLDNGSVTGSMVLALEEFPIGALLTQTFDGADDPDFAEFKNCTTRLRFEGDVTGAYTPSTGKLKGKVKIEPVSEDIHDCLATRPSNVTLNSVTKTTTLGWSGTLKGSTATGRIATKPASPFTATAVE
jgi:hypothetical protein